MSGFRDGLRFDMWTYEKPGIFERLIHFLTCHWVEYMVRGSFDCARRVCLICGRTQATPLQRRYGYEDTGDDFTQDELRDLRKYLERNKYDL